MKFIKLIMLWSALFILLLTVNIHVALHTVSIVDLIFYCIACICIKQLFFQKKLPSLGWRIYDWAWVIGVFIIHTILLMILASIPWHFHFDEFIVAYTSYTLPNISEINWFGAYPRMWVAQFPLLFYILQKPFLLFGPTINAVRISILPYVFGIVWYTYYLTSTLWSKKIARISLLILMTFAPELYLTSTGLHFISSELFYLAAITHLLLFFIKKDTAHLFPLTIFGLLCYLTYTSSYVFLPVLIISTFFVIVVTHKRLFILKYIGIVIAAMLLLFSPFLTYHLKDTPFLTQRIDQVNIISDSWSTTKEKLEEGSSYESIILSQFKSSILSLILPGIGGMGGYEFGHQALLSPVEGIFFVIAVGISIYSLWKKRWNQIIVFFFLFIIPFVAGFVLTTHPPPFHRISILYPWLCMIIAYAMVKIAQLFKKLGNRIVLSVLICSMGAFWIASFFQIKKMITKDLVYTNWDSVRIASYITQNVQPTAPILIASDNLDFHYFYEFTFRFGNQRRVIIADKTVAFNIYKGDQPLLIRYATDDDISKLTKKFRYLHIIRSYEEIPFEYATLVVPQSVIIERMSKPKISDY